MLPAGCLEHRPALDAVERQTDSLERMVLEEAERLGFRTVGVTSAGDLEEDGGRLSAWLSRGYQGGMEYLEKSGRSEPKRLLPQARSIVTVALGYGSSQLTEGEEPTSLRGRIARYALGHDYHNVLKKRLRALADRLALRLNREVVARACVDTAPLLERALAERSGLGFVGKNTLLIVPGQGSWTVLGELLLDVDLPATPATRKRCGSCSACLVSCPTQAFVGPFQLDARRCISYLTIEHRGSIPVELRSLVGNWVFGCDLCQQTCPFNRTPSASRADPELQPRAARKAPSLIELLELGSSSYKRWVKGSALSRVSRNQLARNAAVALGNSGHLDAVDPLRRALRVHASAVVRSHAAWALGHLGALAATNELRERANLDPDEDVRRECRAALAELMRRDSEPG